MIYLLIPIIILILISVKILREYERAVVFTLGRFSGVKGPGLVLILPFVQQIVTIDLRTAIMFLCALVPWFISACSRRNAR
jgi:regulator of protease activity HflC (stomatin/prohibitin superfamily)